MTPRALLFLILTLFIPLAADAESPPPPGPPRTVQFTEPAERTLPNDLRVLAVERAGLPLLAAHFAVRSGSETDPPDAAGLASLTAALLTRGTATRSATEIAAGIEALGGEIGAAAGWDSTSVTLSVLATEADAALAIFADVIRRPAFADAEIDRVKRETLDDLKIAYEEPRTVALLAMQRVLYGSAPYGHPRSGTPRSIARIERDAIARHHAVHFRPDNAILILAGDLTADAAFAQAEKLFADWPKPDAALPSPALSKAAPAARTVIIDMPHAGQAAVVVGSIGIARASDDRLPGLVANGILGNGYTSRLNAEIRIKRGLSYGARSVLQTLARPGPFLAYAQTKNTAALEVAALIRASLTDLAAEPVPEAELEPRVSTLIGDYARALETNAGIADALADLAIYHRPLTELNAYIPSLRAVTAAKARAFVKTELPVENTSLVIAGRAEDFAKAIENSDLKPEIIPQPDLDLEHPTLRK